MEAIGWKPLSATEAAARWPNAPLNETVANGMRAYYTHADGSGFYRQKPIMLTLLRRDDGRTGVDIRIAPFALPQTLEANSDMAGLPKPKSIKTRKGSGNSNSARRKLDVAVIAEIPATLAFYRRELASRGWTEEANGAVVAPDNVSLNFSSAEQTATLKLGTRYDFTIVNLVTQVKESALAARAKAKKEADDRFFSDAAAAAKQIIAADEARRAAQAANLSDAPLRALADNTRPVPLPENAENVKFDGADGRLEFNSSSSVRAIAAFYRASLKAQGWKEQPSVINKSNMVVMEFSKGGKAMSFTAMQMGPKVNVSADGSGLVDGERQNGRQGAVGAQTANEPASKTTDQPLEADPESALPVPKQRTMARSAPARCPAATHPSGGNSKPASRPISDAVLAFYRSELGKRGWRKRLSARSSSPNRCSWRIPRPRAGAAETRPQPMRDIGQPRAEISASSRQGQRHAEAGPGQAGSRQYGPKEASLTINKQTIKIAAGAGGPQSPKGPMLDLPPGKYQYALRLPGQPTRNETLTDSRRRYLGPYGGAKRRRASAADVLIQSSTRLRCRRGAGEQAVDDGCDQKHRSLFSDVHLIADGDVRRRIADAGQTTLRVAKDVRRRDEFRTERLEPGAHDRVVGRRLCGSGRTLAGSACDGG